MIVVNNGLMSCASWMTTCLAHLCDILTPRGAYTDLAVIHGGAVTYVTFLLPVTSMSLSTLPST